jgi:hypothetical protein
MKPIRILVAGIAGGIWLLFLTFLSDYIAILVAPYNIFDIGGMRPPDDPVMAFFFLYPFLFAFIAAFVFELVKGSLRGSRDKKGFIFGVILILLVLVPNILVIFSSMTYPAGFYISNLLSGIIGYPILGILFARVMVEKKQTKNLSSSLPMRLA